MGSQPGELSRGAGRARLPAMAYEMNQLLQICLDQNASDIHITVGRPPSFRISGSVKSLKSPALTPEDTVALMKQITSNVSMPECSDPIVAKQVAVLLRNISRETARFPHLQGCPLPCSRDAILSNVLLRFPTFDANIC